MNTISSLSPQQLRQAADLKERIVSLQEELDRLLGAPPEILVEAPRRRRKHLSAQALANIRAGVRKRVGGLKSLASPAKPTRKRKRRMSAAQKARLSAIAAARWKKVKAQGKSKL
jgi:hypothetical protein